MARDYSKPGNTPPGTKHARPARTEKKTWLDHVAPAEGYALKEQPKLPDTVPFTRPLHDPADAGITQGRRRERRRIVRELGKPFAIKLVTKDEPFLDVVGDARKMRRLTQARRDRQQRRGQRAFDRQVLATNRERDLIGKLVEVSERDDVPEVVRQNATFGLQRRMESIRNA